MACATCGAKQQAQTNRSERNVQSREILPCTYTLEQLVTILPTLTNDFQIAIVKSAINFIHRDCNKFKPQLDKIFQGESP